jgi:small subunit ribosomal protein S11
LTGRLAAQSFLRKPLSTTARVSPVVARSFSQASSKQADKPKTTALLEDLYGPGYGASSPKPKAPSTMDSLMGTSLLRSAPKSQSSLNTNALTGEQVDEIKGPDYTEPYHFHIYSHKHNTHVTCTRPDRSPIISMSCGNLGYRKARRGAYDSAYSLVKYVIERMIYNDVPSKIGKLEIVLRGFGQGREAALKVLMSPEGKILRDKIVRVADSTRLKFGGTRSKGQRRL